MGAATLTQEEAKKAVCQILEAAKDGWISEDQLTKALGELDELKAEAAIWLAWQEGFTIISCGPDGTLRWRLSPEVRDEAE